MKDTLKMQGVTRPVVGIKKLIDYYNENYTRKGHSHFLTIYA